MEAQKRALAEALAGELPLDAETVFGLIIPCKLAEHGDLSFPCFTLAKSLRKNPALIAKELEEKFQDGDLGRFKAVGPYLNVKFDESQVARKVLTEIRESESGYGRGSVGEGQTIVIDYSSPNIAKPFGIGHLRSTVIGRSLKRLYESQGYRVVGINHLGDWGTQFGLMIAAWKRWGDEVDLKAEDKVEAFYKLYVRINQLAKEDSQVKAESREWFRKLEEGDREARELWEFFRKTSLEEFEKVYELLGVEFEEVMGEAFYNDKMDAVIEKLESKGLTEESDGALIIDLDKHEENLGICLLKKDDGATLYATRDITAAYYRAESYQPSKILYVVGMPQRQHFKQWFKVIELMGEEWAQGLVYVGFGHYLGMSTRLGTVVFLKEVLERTQEKAHQIAQDLKTREQIELTPEEIETVGRQVGMGAVIFFDFRSRRVKDLEFDWDRMLNLKGDSGPYVQWTYARCCGILRKHARETRVDVDFSLLTGDEARHLFKVLGRFPSQIERALKEYEPSLIASYLIDLARAANAFIHVSNVIHSEDELRDARALVVECTRRVLGQGLYLLGIEALSKM